MECRAPQAQAALEKALEDTFEGIAFAQIFNRRVLEEKAQEDGDELSAYIDLPDPLHLRFFIMMKREHVIECFEAVYTGFDVSTVEEAVLDDFVKELTNTAAGHFTSILAPEKKDMRIGLPITPDEVARDACLTPSESTNVVFFQVEDYELYSSLVKI